MAFQEADILFEYMYDGWIFKGTFLRGFYYLRRKSPKASRWETIVKTTDSSALDKYKNREVHPTRSA